MTILEQFQQRAQTKELFLWAHLSLLALLPLTLALVMAGLAVGDPLLPGWIEMPVLALPIVTYVVWQQWHRPIYPFSLGFVHRSVNHLSVLQKQILTIVKRPATGWIAVVVGVFLYSCFRQIYLTAPLAEDIAPFPDSLRFLGIVWALVFFFLANVITQVGIVALRILVLPETELSQEYDQDKIKQDFTVLGASSDSLWQFEQDKPDVETPIPSQEASDAPAPQEAATSTNQPSPPENATLPDIPDLVFNTETPTTEE